MHWSLKSTDGAGAVAFWCSLAAVAITWMVVTGCAPLPWRWCP